MDATTASVQVGTTVPARSAVPVDVARPVAPASTAGTTGSQAQEVPVPGPRPVETKVWVEHDERSGHNIVSVVDAVTHEVLIQIPPESVRAVIQGLVDMVREKQERR